MAALADPGGNLSNRANSLRFQRKISQRLDLSRGQTLAQHQQQEAEPELVAVGT
jgi:hypothetical protein